MFSFSQYFGRWLFGNAYLNFEHFYNHCCPYYYYILVTCDCIRISIKWSCIIIMEKTYTIKISISETERLSSSHNGVTLFSSFMLLAYPLSSLYFFCPSRGNFSIDERWCYSCYMKVAFKWNILNFNIYWRDYWIN